MDVYGGYNDFYCVGCDVGVVISVLCWLYVCCKFFELVDIVGNVCKGKFVY